MTKKRKNRQIKIIGGILYWNSAKAAKFIGVSPPTLLRLANAGIIACQAISRRKFFRLEVLRAYLTQGGKKNEL